MSTMVLNAYKQLTETDQKKVSEYIFSLIEKYPKNDSIKKFSKEDEETFNYFTGSLPKDFDSKKAISENKSEKYGI